MLRDPARASGPGGLREWRACGGGAAETLYAARLLQRRLCALVYMYIYVPAVVARSCPPCPPMEGTRRPQRPLRARPTTSPPDHRTHRGVAQYMYKVHAQTPLNLFNPARTLAAPTE